MKNDDSLFPMPGKPGRPKSNPLSRADQNREAQARRREKLQSEGKTSHTFALSAVAVDALCRIKDKEGSKTLQEAAEAAFLNYAYKSANVGLLPADLVEGLEEIFTEVDLHEALIQAAAKWVAEVKRKRASARRSRGK